MLRNVFVLLFTVLIAGCVSVEETMTSLYNIKSSGTSMFDGSKYIRISNMICDNSIMFELYQDSAKSKNNIVLLKAGRSESTNIGKGDSLHIKLDGKTYSYKSSVELTEHETIHLGNGVTMPFSYKPYIVPESAIREAATSNIFLVKMYFLNSTFIEAKCSSVTLQESQEKSKKHGLSITQHDVDVGNKYTAINGFRNFVEMMDSTSW